MTRLHLITEKVDKGLTGLKASLFVHVQYDARGRFQSVGFSEKGKEGGTLDKVLEALGDTATDIIRNLSKPDTSLKETK